ncbi:hypothetical protein CQA57_07015 [Helicobacter anseris]|uniref:Uncharacterized protein n=1 Tax=Helicobacter anseris TaxID=375926 RepID=A0A3D8J584_9HELI|nr:hypothetical protein [Helicobacter anseris]RDU72346.1 hypothetical protein CQA57_07015 [Helicobacter anseris]
MGNRLVLNMKKDGNDVATGYFHWSASTTDSAEILDNVLYYLDNNDEEINKRYIYALYSVGAGLTEEAKETIKEKNIDLKLVEGIDRNSGIIDITEEAMNEAIQYAEILITIDYLEDTKSFIINCEQMLYQDTEVSKEDAENSNCRVIEIDFELNNLNIIKAFDFIDIVNNSTYEDVFVVNNKVYKHIFY